ncbi:MAG: hypothetical protein MI784_02470 [Cytophagales bacterium]|nr:hypothetical protein [Cytophagales bacterium]
MLLNLSRSRQLRKSALERSQSIACRLPIQCVRRTFEQSEWKKGLQKGERSTARFFVSSLRHAIIVPPGFSYPHLTLDIDETRFEKSKSGEWVHVTITQAHYSPAPFAPRLVFYFEKENIFRAAEPYENMDSVLGKANRWLRQSGLEVVFVGPHGELPKEPVAEQAFAEEESGSEGSEEEELAVPQVESLPIESLSIGGDPKAKAPKKGKGSGGGKKGKKRKKKRKRKRTPAAKPAEPVAPVKVKDSLAEWQELLEVGNLEEALENFSIDSLSSRQWLHFKTYFEAFFEKHELIKTRFFDEIFEKHKVMKAKIEKMLDFFLIVAYKGKADNPRYQRTSSKGAQAVVSYGEGRLREARLGEMEKELGAAQFTNFLRFMRPSDFSLPEHKPVLPEAADEKEKQLYADKMEAYRLAGLFTLKRAGVLHLESVRTESFGVADMLAVFLNILLQKDFTPELNKEFDKIRPFLSRMYDHFLLESIDFFRIKFESTEQLEEFLKGINLQYDTMEQMIAYLQQYVFILNRLIPLVLRAPKKGWGKLNRAISARLKPVLERLKTDKGFDVRLITLEILEEEINAVLEPLRT